MNGVAQQIALQIGRVRRPFDECTGRGIASRHALPNEVAIAQQKAIGQIGRGGANANRRRRFDGAGA